jgi:hypothetical protein
MSSKTQISKITKMKKWNHYSQRKSRSKAPLRNLITPAPLWSTPKWRGSSPKSMPNLCSLRNLKKIIVKEQSHPAHEMRPKSSSQSTATVVHLTNVCPCCPTRHLCSWTQPYCACHSPYKPVSSPTATSFPSHCWLTDRADWTAYLSTFPARWLSAEFGYVDGEELRK